MAVTGSTAVKHVVVSIASATTTEIVAAVAGKVIRVLSYTLSPLTPTTWKWQSSTGTVALSGTFVVVGVAYSAHGSRDLPLLETAAGDALQIVTTGATVSLQGHISYTVT